MTTSGEERVAYGLNSMPQVLPDVASVHDYL